MNALLAIFYIACLVEVFADHAADASVIGKDTARYKIYHHSNNERSRSDSGKSEKTVSDYSTTEKYLGTVSFLSANSEYTTLKRTKRNFFSRYYGQRCPGRTLWVYYRYTCIPKWYNFPQY